MKHIKWPLLLIVTSLFLFAECNISQDIPTGCWQSSQGKPSVTLKKDSAGNFQAIIHHHTANGHICPVVYPLVKDITGMYIQAEGRILVSYSPKDSTLFLSPGGVFRLKQEKTSDVKEE